MDLNTFDEVKYNPFKVAKGNTMVDTYPDLELVSEFSLLPPFDHETTDHLVRILGLYCDPNSPLNKIKDVQIRKGKVVKLLKPCPGAIDAFLTDNKHYLKLMFYWFNHIGHYKYQLFITEEIAFMELLHDARNGSLSVSQKKALNETANAMIANLEKARQDLFPDQVSKASYIKHEAEDSISGAAERYAKSED